jgi:hypothetical protein
VEEDVEVEITLTNQSGKPPKKPCKGRAIPKKDQDRKLRSELALDPEDKEFWSVWEHDPLVLHPLEEDLDIPPIDPFLLQEAYIQL